MQLSLQTDYALRVLIYLMCRPGQRASTREMAGAYGISLHHLTKVAKTLTKQGWLLSARGGGGGLMLAGHTPRVRIGEIVRFFENTDLAECFQPLTNTCPISGVCQLKGILHQARRAFFEVLDSFTVQDLARQSGEINRLLEARLRDPEAPESMDPI